MKRYSSNNSSAINALPETKTINDIISADMALMPQLIEVVHSLLKVKHADKLLELIYKPNSSIHVTFLLNLYNHAKTEYIDDTEEDEYPVDDFCYASSPNWDLPIEFADREAVRQVYKRRNQLIEAKCIVESQNNLARAEELRDEIDQLTDWLNKAVNRIGRLKYETSQDRKNYYVIHKGLANVVEKIRAIDPELGNLCDRHLVYGMTPCWRSDPMV